MYQKITQASAAVVLIFGSAFVVATPADAITPSPDEGAYVLALEARMDDASDEQIADLSARDLALLRKYAVPVTESSTTRIEQVASTDPHVASLAAATGSAASALCYTATSSRTAKGALGNDLYKSWHVGRWCRSATTVTSASRAEQGWQTFWLGWSGKGLIGGSAGVVSNQGRSYSQHAFQYQLGTPSPTQYTQPCTRIRGTATPGYFADYVCGLYS